MALGSLPGTSAHDYTGITPADSWDVPHLVSALADHVSSLNLSATLGASGSVKDKDGKTPFDVAEHDDEIKRECLVDCVVVCEEVGVLMILATSI